MDRREKVLLYLIIPTMNNIGIRYLLGMKISLVKKNQV